MAPFESGLRLQFESSLHGDAASSHCIPPQAPGRAPGLASQDEPAAADAGRQRYIVCSSAQVSRSRQDALEAVRYSGTRSHTLLVSSPLPSGAGGGRFFNAFTKLLHVVRVRLSCQLVRTGACDTLE